MLSRHSPIAQHEPVMGTPKSYPDFLVIFFRRRAGIPVFALEGLAVSLLVWPS